MLNPEFRWLDPEMESLERFASLTPAKSPALDPGAWLKQLDFSLQAVLAQKAAAVLSKPGVHSKSEVEDAIRAAGNASGLEMPEACFYSWPESGLRSFLSGFSEPIVLLLGILDGEGIWAGIMAGVSRRGLDFLTTFRHLWLDDPELAARQSLHDLASLCRAAGARFGRHAGGLFIYRNEFMEWRDRNWDSGLLHHFLNSNTAVKIGC